MCVRACMCTHMCRICMHMDAEGRGWCQVSSFLTCQLTLWAMSSHESGAHQLTGCWTLGPTWFLSEVLGLERGQASFPGPSGILLLTGWLILSTYKVMGYIIKVSYTDNIVTCSYLLHLPPFLICTIIWDSPTKQYLLSFYIISMCAFDNMQLNL